MKPEQASQRLLAITRSKAKMYEYGVPEEHHIKIARDPAQLFRLTIGLLGDIAASINRTAAVDKSDLSDGERNLTFAARFFDAYLEARLRSEIDSYLLLLASSAFYLSDLPGSSLVLARKVPSGTLDLAGAGLERLLNWLLIGASKPFLDDVESAYRHQIDACATALTRFYEKGSGEDELFAHSMALRTAVYETGTPRQLLLADIASAVVRKRYSNSARRCLPLFSDLAPEMWSEAFKKERFVRELWPSQQLLGEKGLFQGTSAIVQMPTSAGKTRATELILRSAFLSGRTSSAVIVAPFRALCHEISDALREAFRGESIAVDEMTDVLQVDFDFDFDLDDILNNKKVLVVTPEKLVYVLRHSPELAQSVGLVIYDEGHQFDSGLRGVTYELLLASLRRMIPADAQSILISAVISNADAVGEWLHGSEPTIASGSNLVPMYRTVAFASWLDQLGQLKFVGEATTATDDFFVPRVLTQHELSRRPRERKARFFPERNDGQSIALYLGVKLVSQGSVAVFCGRKPAAASLCEKIVEAYGRDVALKKPLEYSDQAEVTRLASLYRANLGASAASSNSAAIGIFSHHGNTPHGIRLAVEHAMKTGDAKFVICTSTLAQGVNLPIRYLIVTSVYQGEERIKVRDFHNLIGRAGRAGMHTEGTILFADPDVYDKKSDRKERWRWTQIQELLEPKNSEPVVSSLRTLFEPLQNDEQNMHVRMGPLDFVRAYVQGKDYVRTLLASIAKAHGDKGFTEKGLEAQASWRFDIFATIESYLMSYWDEALGEAYIQELAQGTLAYFLSNEDEKKQLVELFQILGTHIKAAVPEEDRRKVFGRTLQGLAAIIDLEAWIEAHLDALQEADSHEDLLRLLWPVIADGIGNSTFRKLEKPELLAQVAISWLSGKPYSDLFSFLLKNGVKIKAGKQRRGLKIDHVVDLCENAFGYDGALRIGAVADLLASRSTDDEDYDAAVQSLNELHKRFKYGLPFSSAVSLYECGFADRVIAIHLSSVIDADPVTRGRAIQLLREDENKVRATLRTYPKYFQTVLAGLLA